jgi:hypothetical protein
VWRQATVWRQVSVRVSCCHAELRRENSEETARDGEAERATDGREGNQCQQRYARNRTIASVRGICRLFPPRTRNGVHDGTRMKEDRQQSGVGARARTDGRQRWIRCALGRARRRRARDSCRAERRRCGSIHIQDFRYSNARAVHEQGVPGWETQTALGYLSKSRLEQAGRRRADDRTERYRWCRGAQALSKAGPFARLQDKGVSKTIDASLPPLVKA